MNKQTIYIIRGIPGSGKTTEARRMMEGRPNLRHFEADMFFEKDGKYLFDFTKIKDAHKWCQNQVRQSLADGFDVIVSNTFVKKWEMDAYIKMAKELAVNCETWQMSGNFENVHGVPAPIVERMRREFEE